VTTKDRLLAFAEEEEEEEGRVELFFSLLLSVVENDHPPRCRGA
jgi:hypothetical protein